MLDGTLEAIMWAKWGSPSILAGIGDLHINNSDARYEIVFIEAKIDGLLRSLLKKKNLR